MEKKRSGRKLEFGVVICGLLIAGTAFSGYVFKKIARARSERPFKPHLPKMSIHLKSSGFQASSLAGQGILEREAINLVDTTARWAEFEILSSTSSKLANQASVVLSDSDGHFWPSTAVRRRSSVFVFVAKGYSSVKPLNASLRFGPTILESIRFPDLPAPIVARRPKLREPWKGLKIMPTVNSAGGIPTVTVSASATLQKGHILVGRIAGSSSCERERIDDSYIMLANIVRPRSPIDNNLFVNLFYPDATREAYVQLEEREPNRRTLRVRFANALYVDAKGWPAVDRSRVTLALPNGDKFFLNEFPFLEKKPKASRPSAIHFSLSSKEYVDSAQVRMVSPTSYRGVPIRLDNTIWTFSTDPTTLAGVPGPD